MCSTRATVCLNSTHVQTQSVRHSQTHMVITVNKLCMERPVHLFTFASHFFLCPPWRRPLFLRGTLKNEWLAGPHDQTRPVYQWQPCSLQSLVSHSCISEEPPKTPILAYLDFLKEVSQLVGKLTAPIELLYSTSMTWVRPYLMRNFHKWAAGCRMGRALVAMTAKMMIVELRSLLRQSSVHFTLGSRVYRADLFRLHVAPFGVNHQQLPHGLNPGFTFTRERGSCFFTERTSLSWLNLMSVDSSKLATTKTLIKTSIL